jgi:HK97 family phage prohead protease
MVTNPGGTERLHQYWVHGEGAAKIRWGEPNDFARCVEHLGKYIRDPKGYCNLAHKAALGFYPATHAAMEHGRAAVADTKTPYGPKSQVSYADPGYQADKKARYPLDSADHCKAAWSYINMPKNAAQYSSEHLAAIKGRIKAALKRYGVTVSEDQPASRDEQGPQPFVRSFPLQDVSIRAGGDGRTVDAYATVFDTPAPIHDQDGDYIEVIDRRAFDRILPKLAPSGGRSAWRCGVFYNHAMNLHGQPSDIDSMPIGVPLEIKADGHGLFTRTRYHKGDRADQVLEAIREGSLAGYSFSGAFHRSTPLVPRGGFRPDRGGNLPTVRRTESTLREYGPTPFPAYQGAAITGVRAEQITEQLAEIAELLRSGAPLPQYDNSGAPHDGDLPPGDLPSSGRSDRSAKQEMQAARSAFLQRHRR